MKSYVVALGTTQFVKMRFYWHTAGPKMRVITILANTVSCKDELEGIFVVKVIL